MVPAAWHDMARKPGATGQRDRVVGVGSDQAFGANGRLGVQVEVDVVFQRGLSRGGWHAFLLEGGI